MHTAPLMFAAFALLARGLVGCNSATKERPERSGEESKHPPSELIWKEKEGLSHQLRVGHDEKIEFFCCMLDDGKMTVHAAGLYLSMYAIRIGEEEYTPTDNFTDNRRISVQDRLGPITLASLQEAEQKHPADFKFDVPIAITKTNSLPASTTLSMSVNPAAAISAMVNNATKNPVTFTNEAADATADALIALWEAPYFSVHHRDTAKTLADLDWVAVPKWIDTGKKRNCGGYSRSPGGIGGTLEFSLEDVDLDVFERRTAKKVASKRFPAGSTCPSVVSKARGETLSLGPDRRLMKAWLDQGVARGSFDSNNTR